MKQSMTTTLETNGTDKFPHQESGWHGTRTMSPEDSSSSTTGKRTTNTAFKTHNHEIKEQERHTVYGKTATVKGLQPT